MNFRPPQLATFTVTAVTLLAVTGCGTQPGPAATDGVALDRSAPNVGQLSQNQQSPNTDQENTGPDGAQNPDSNPGQATAPGGVDQMLAAGRTAQSRLGGTVVTIDWERSAWEVTVVMDDGSEHDIVLSSAGSEVIAGPFDEREDAEDLSENQAMVQAATSTYAEAVQIAHDAASNGVLHDLDLELEYGQATWEASYHTAAGAPEKTVIVADNGEIIYNGIDD